MTMRWRWFFERGVRAMSIAGMCLAMAIVSGCDRNENAVSGPVAASATSAASAALSAGAAAEDGSPAQRQWRNKLNAYVQVNNKLIDSTGLHFNVEVYRALGSAAGNVRSNISSQKTFFDDSLADLRRARALPGRIDELDAAADALIPALESLATRFGELDSDESAKAALERRRPMDKSKDAAVKAAFQSSFGPADQFDAACHRAIAERNARRLETLKQSGDMLEYDTLLAMNQARTLVESFKTTRDLRNPAVLARTRPTADALDKTLTDLRAEIAKAHADSSGDSATSARLKNDENILEALTAVSSDFRDIGTDRGSTDHDELFLHFNTAVTMANVKRSSR